MSVTKTKKCPKCHGRGSKICQTCHGEGEIVVAVDGKLVTQPKPKKAKGHHA